MSISSLLPPLFLLSLTTPTNGVLRLAPCSPAPSITFRGGNDVTRGAGRSAFIFAPLQCANCYNFLRRLNDIAVQRNHRIFVVAPDFESNHIIQRTGSAFPNLQIDRAGEGWPRLGAANFDAFIVDNCGRVAETLTWPSTDVTSSHVLLNSLDGSTSRNTCGTCHVAPPRGNFGGNSNNNKKINAYLEKKERSRQHQQTAPYHTNYPPPTTTTTTTTQKPPKSDDDYDYYNNEQLEQPRTTQSTQTQIPRPPSANSNSNFPPYWPTFSPQLQQQFYQQQNGQKTGHYGQNPMMMMMMENNLPCSAFTDDICYQQRERMGAQMSKCCNKGIYLTDVCVPGKCSNSTTQLCCFQKFLQAKYSCCNDPTQDEGDSKLTNNFNKCCHNLFITEDPCCPETAAKKYWSSAYEVCMPTVTVDFSPVRFEVHFTEGVRVLDLSADRQWEFNCTFGAKKQQFAYLP